MRLHNLGIARKLWLGVIFLIVANMFIVGFSGVRTATLTARFDAAFAQLDAKLAVAQEWASQSEAEANRAAVLSHTPGAIDPMAVAREQSQAKLVTLRQQLDDLPLDEADRAQLARIDAAQAQFQQALAQTPRRSSRR